jgi:hemin uptake protein HemP
VRQSETNHTDEPPKDASSEAEGQAPVRSLASSELLRGAKSVEISHNGAVYRLQATRLGKLILTK